MSEEQEFIIGSLHNHRIGLESQLAEREKRIKELEATLQDHQGLISQDAFNYPKRIRELEARIKELEAIIEDGLNAEHLLNEDLTKKCLKLEAQIAEAKKDMDLMIRAVHYGHHDGSLKSCAIGICASRANMLNKVYDGSQLLNAIGKARDVLDKTVTHWSKRKWNWGDEFEWTRIFQNTKEVLDSLKPYAGKK